MKSSNILRSLVLAFVTILSFSQSAKAQQTNYLAPGSFTWTAPAGVYCARVYMIAAGGGGGGNGTGSDGGGAGAGGGFTEAYITVIPGSVYTVTVGTGGNGGVGNNSGTAGSDSWFGTTATIIAFGGGGGNNPISGSAGIRGFNGGFGTSTGTGVIATRGGNGGNGNNHNNGKGGGGGASAGPFANGANGTNANNSNIGLGAASFWGSNGGDGGDAADGVDATWPGCGGGGAGESSNGGDGSDGLVIVIVDAPQCPLSSTVSPAASQSVCQGNPTSALTAASTTTGNCGAPTTQYQWYSNTTNSNTVAGATLIAGATASSYTPPNATTGTLYYFCVAFAADNGCAQTNATQSLATAAVQVDITPGPCAVDYFQNTVGILSSYAGSCPVVEDNGTFFDDGGSGANYSHSINAIYRTFCPETAGTCVNLNFTSFATSNANDFLYVQNGPAQNSPAIVQAPTNASGQLFGDLSASTPFSFQSTNSSGCLTLRFSSNGPSLNDIGWAAAITNVACTEAQSIGNSDCATATQICTNTSFNDISNGPGLNTSEGCDACLTGEAYSNWYVFSIASTGTLGLTITPSAAADYDFTIYNGSCGGPMERCSFSGVVGNTGLGGGAVDLTEGTTGNSWVSTMNVTVGEVYYLMVNSWTAGGPGFDLTWDLTSGASLDCAPLPIELTSFTAIYSPETEGTDLYWKTETERENDYFTVERSRDGIVFEEVFQVKGAGTTTSSTEYFAFDPDVELGVTYYRLKQTDFNGTFDYSEIIAINALSNEIDILSINPNPATDETDLFYNNYKNESSIMKVLNGRGEIIHSRVIESHKGGNFVTLDLKDYAQGMYFVKIITSNKTFTGKLVKK